MLNIPAAGLGFLLFVASITLTCGIAYLNAGRLENWVRNFLSSKH